MNQEFQFRSYSKKELALMYFPKSTNPHAAVNQLISWIKGCKPLYDELQSMGYNKMRKYFTPREVRSVIAHLGEP